MHNKNVYKKLNSISKNKMPLSNYSFSLFLFIKKLAAQCMEEHISDVFFLAREGKFLKKLYDTYTVYNTTAELPKSHYLYISRKAAMNATLRFLEQEDFKTMAAYGRMSVTKLLKALSFSKDEIDMVSKNMEDQMDIEFADFFSSPVFYKLKENYRFRELYETKRVKAHENFSLYLKKSGYIGAERAAVVDVGWNGTIQNHLYAMNIHEKLSGYYLGCRAITNDKYNIKRGLLFHTKSSVQTFAHYCHNYEYLCVADHGAVVSYDSDGKPMLEDDFDVVLYESGFREVQNNLIEKFEMICSVLSDAVYQEKELESFLTYQHVRMMKYFSKEEKRIMMDAKTNHPDNLVAISPKLSWKHYLFFIKRAVYLQCQVYKYRFLSLSKV